MFNKSFLSLSFLKSFYAHEYITFKGSDLEQIIFKNIKQWSERKKLKERSAQSAFIHNFFYEIWGYREAGQQLETFSLWPDFKIKQAGQRGHAGFADAALGFFYRDERQPIPQVVVEFKDDTSGLDLPQNRRGRKYSPVKQGLNYLQVARFGFYGHEPILPLWAIITDMNEFRLYWVEKGDRQYISFIIKDINLLSDALPLLSDNEDSRFYRFLFYKIFQINTLTVQAKSGKPELLTIIEKQRFQQNELENAFYSEYKIFRQYLYENLLKFNHDPQRFPGTKARLVQLTQKILDRMIFVFFCEDMGRALSFPPMFVRDYFIKSAGSSYYEPNSDDIWCWLKKLFNIMDKGGHFGNNDFNCFNGGLFAEDEELNKLFIPNFLFCEKGQDQNEETLSKNKNNFLYFSAHYNYATSLNDGLTYKKGGKEQKTIGLYTLGRIFEQSITELEILTAKEEGRPSINESSKRKRDGVYYTPEWVVEKIVEETVGKYLKDVKTEIGFIEDELPTLSQIKLYEETLSTISIIDPACGSGAFLITALARLIEEWKYMLSCREQAEQKAYKKNAKNISVWTDSKIREILKNNLYGVDINPASVEITKLSLWLHTVRDESPLSSLEHTIRVGNALIGPDFYKYTLAPYNQEEKERVNAFDWSQAFPEIFITSDKKGFDCVIGNPPYVRIQNFRKAHADMADYLARDIVQDGQYQSTQKGNFDLYLAFIEKGIKLLNKNGYMGYIAPSVWVVNDYGKGLRDFIAQGHYLWGWVDFGSYQIFKEATTYTALQFFSKKKNNSIAIVKPVDGIIADDIWNNPEAQLPYDKIDFYERWLLISGKERQLLDKMSKDSYRLDNQKISSDISVGIQTSFDKIYHLKRIGKNKYEAKPLYKNDSVHYVEIEDTIMKPLVSGKEVKRYQTPQTDIYLLFPYKIEEDHATLLSEIELKENFPKAWLYLKYHEKDLRGREGGKFNDNQWYRFGRHQNIDKQEKPKLMVPRLVMHLMNTVDKNGYFYMDNVDVGSIIPNKNISCWYISAFLNSRSLDFIFRRISKPFHADFFSANKQFIAPLPVPRTTKRKQEEIAQRAEYLQSLYDKKRDIYQASDERLKRLEKEKLNFEDFFSDFFPLKEMEKQAPKHLKKINEKRKWAKTEQKIRKDKKIEEIDQFLVNGRNFNIIQKDDEISFKCDDIIIFKIFRDPESASFIASQWRIALFSLLDQNKLLASSYFKILTETTVIEADLWIRKKIIDLEDELQDVRKNIKLKEEEMNNIIYSLYKLSTKDKAYIEQDRVRDRKN